MKMTGDIQGSPTVQIINSEDPCKHPSTQTSYLVEWWSPWWTSLTISLTSSLHWCRREKENTTIPPHQKLGHSLLSIATHTCEHQFHNKNLVNGKECNLLCELGTNHGFESFRKQKLSIQLEIEGMANYPPSFRPCTTGPPELNYHKKRKKLATIPNWYHLHVVCNGLQVDYHCKVISSVVVCSIHENPVALANNQIIHYSWILSWKPFIDIKNGPIFQCEGGSSKYCSRCTTDCISSNHQKHWWILFAEEARK